MYSQHTFNEQHAVAKTDRRVVYLHKLDTETPQYQIEQAVRGRLQGNFCNFHWEVDQSEGVGIWDHDGWCHVEFPDQSSTQSALRSLSDLTIRGIKAVAALAEPQPAASKPTHAAKAATSASSHPRAKSVLSPPQTKQTGASDTSDKAKRDAMPKLGASRWSEFNIAADDDKIYQERQAEQAATKKLWAEQGEPQQIVKEKWINTSATASERAGAETLAIRTATQSAQTLQTNPAVALLALPSTHVASVPAKPDDKPPHTKPTPLLSRHSNAAQAATRQTSKAASTAKSRKDPQMTQSDMEYPAKWVFNSEFPAAYRDNLFKSYRELDESYKQEGKYDHFRLAEDHDRKPRFHCRQYPDPEKHRENLDTPYVQMFNISSTWSETEPIESFVISTKWERWALKVETVPLSEVSIRERDGWNVWEHPPSPLDFSKGDRDLRGAERPEDVQTVDRPQADIVRNFPRGNEFVRVESTEQWIPGHLIGRNGSPEEAKASSLSYSEFRCPSELTDLRSATSIAHFPKYLRPTQAGYNWGDYDQFYLWQAYGRQIRKPMVPYKEWDTDPWQTMVFEAEDGTTRKVEPLNVTEDDDDGRNDPISLWQKLNPPPKSQNRGGLGRGRGGMRGSYPARGRGGRGRGW